MTAAIRAYLYPWPSLATSPHPTLAEALAASLARHESVRAS